MLHRMSMLRGPKHRQRLMVVGEALMSKFMSLVLMNFQVHVDVDTLHAWQVIADACRYCVKSRALHLLEYELETLMLHRMPMLHGPKHRRSLMVVGEAVTSKLVSLVLMNLKMNVDILHA
jgi:hypothetical protein